MAIKHIARQYDYIGLSTDDKSAITTDGAVIYYVDTKKREILLDGAWTEYVDNMSADLEVSDIQIGAVEIKDATTDTRAVVGVSGLSVDVKDIVSSDLESSSLGQYGGKYIADTVATTPDEGYVFTSIQVISDCMVTLVGNITGITSVTLTEGTVVYGRFTSVTLTSGKVIAYQGV